MAKPDSTQGSGYCGSKAMIAWFQRYPLDVQILHQMASEQDEITSQAIFWHREGFDMRAVIDEAHLQIRLAQMLEDMIDPRHY